MAGRGDYGSSALLIGDAQREQGEPKSALLRPLPTRLRQSEGFIGGMACMAAVAFWSGAWIAAKLALGGFTPIQIALGRFAIVGVGLLFALRYLEPNGRLNLRRDGRWLLLAGLATAAQQFIWATGLVYTTASNGALISATGPIVTSLFALALGQERPSIRYGIGVALGFAGVAVVVGWNAAVTGPAELFGDVLMFAAIVAWALAAIATAPLLRHYSPLRETAYSMTLAAVVLLPIAAFESAESWDIRPDSLALGGFVYLVIPATLLAFLSWHAGIRRLGASGAMVFFYLQPILTVALAAILLGESIRPAHIVGAIIVFLGIAIVQRSRSPRTIGKGIDR